jgi:DNA-binding MarR family transcriptional regulator
MIEPIWSNGTVGAMGERLDPVLTSAGYLLLKAGTQFHALIDDALAELDLTGRQFLVLTFAGGAEPLSQLDVSRRLGIDPTIVVGLIDGLEARRLVKRARDPDDRRRYLLELTAAGRRLHTAAATAVAAQEREFLAPIAAADRKQLRALLIDVMTSRLPWLGTRETG